MTTINGNSLPNSLNGLVDFPLFFDLDDIINGFEGDDILAGLNTNDTLNGGLGNDTLNGGDGDDEVNGDEGNDIAVGSIGYDVINGGAGFDRVDYSTLGSIVTLSAFGAINKGSLGADLLVSVEEIVGSNILGDVIDLSGATAPAATSTNVNLALGKITVNGSSSPLPLNFSVIQFENVRGSNLADTITGNTANNSLSGAGGNDTIDGGTGNDIINGGAGIDTASYASASAGVSVSLAFQGVAQNTLNAGSDLLISIENLSGSSFADTLTGNLLANLITAGDGNDTIFGSAGNDSINGGAGTDTANYSTIGGLVSLGAFGVLNKGTLGIDSLVGVETVVGSFLLGDTVDHSAAISSGSVVFSGTNTNLTTGLVTVNGTGAPLPLSFTVQQFENVIGSNSNDTITGDAAANSLTGGAGNDTINGLGGNDTINGGTGIDTASYDTVAAGVNVSLALQGSAQNTLAAGSDLLISIENLIGTAFNDSLTGDAANNSLASGAGNDIIFASTGNDSINGGAGLDTANYSTLGGLVTLGAFGVLNKGGFGIDSLVGVETVVGSILLGDTVDHSAAISSGSVVFSGTNTNLTTGLVTVNGTGAPLPLSFTVQQFENVIGSNSSDTITGNTANNSLNAGSGNDIIFGSSGNDIINGGAGTDTANYSTIGGLVTLGAFGVLNKGTLGIDSLVGVETVVGSSLLGDTVDHSAAISSGSVVFSGTNTNLTTGLVTVNGTGAPLPLSFTVQQFEHVIGSNSNDTITGDAAANSLTGGAGNDTINGLGGNDTINGGIGIDTASYDTLAAGVNVSLALQGSAQNTLAAGSDLLISIENLIGTAFNDTLTGDAANNSLASGAGNDIIFASTGNDTIDGGSGTDIANYSALGGVVNLGAFGLLNKGGLGIDNLIGIETIVGSSLLGDTVDHSAASSSGGVIVSGTNTNLTTGVVTVNGTGAPLPLTFNVQQFENVIGSNFNDTITGNTANNSLAGGAGDDIILGDSVISSVNPIFAYNNKFYTLSTAAGWAQAQAQAISLGGNLVTVNDAAENQFLVNTFGGTERLWIGLTDEVTEGVFRWANGEAITYTNFARNQPDNFRGLEDYVEINFAAPGIWNDLPEGEFFRGIIEIDNSADTLVGGAGNDTIGSLGGSDSIDGGSGIDTVSYDTLATGVNVSLALQGSFQNTGAAGSNLLISIENLIGTAFNDSLAGDTANNSLAAGAGNDSIFGSSANDTIDGGSGTDIANYSALGGVVSLGAFGLLNKGGLGIDNLIGIETIVGSSLLGDTVDHSAASSSGGVVVSGTNTNLTTGVVTVNGTGAPLPLSFTVQQFENVIGSNFNDTIIGNTANNSLTGGAGNDTISGLGGSDSLTGGFGRDVFLYTSVTESAAGVASRDTITDFQLGFDKLDLGAIDANSLFALDQAFRFLGNSAKFTSAGQLRYQVTGGNLFLFGNIDANFATSEFELQLSGLANITASDIIL